MIRVDLKLDLPTQKRRALTHSGSGLLDALTDPFVLISTVLILFAAVAFLGLNLTSSNRQREIEQSIATLRATASQIEAEIGQAEDLRTQRETIGRHVDNIRKIDTNRFAFAHLLDNLANATPAELWVESVNETRRSDTGEVTADIEGVAPSNEVLTQFIDRIENSPFLGNVVFKAAQQMTMSSQTAVRFGLSVTTTLPDAAYLEMQSIRATGVDPVSSRNRSGSGVQPLPAPGR